MTISCKGDICIEFNLASLQGQSSRKLVINLQLHLISFPNRLLKTSSKLRQLDLRGCEKITHQAFSVRYYHCTHLDFVKLSDVCFNVSKLIYFRSSRISRLFH